MAKRYDLGSVIGKIIFNFDESGTKKAKKSIDETKITADNFTEKLDKSSKSAVASLMKVAKGFAVAAASSAALSGAANLVVGLATELQHLSGIAGLLPALMFAGAAAIGTLTLGLQGFGDALKDAGDPTKFAEDLKQLAPEARDTARAFQSIRPQLVGLRLAVQNALFDNTASIVQRLGRTYVPLLKTELSGMAGALNQGVQQFGLFAENKKTVDDLHTSFGNSRVAVDILTNSVQPLLGVLRDVGTVGSSFLPMLAREATSLATRFGQWVAAARQSGKLKEWIQSGIDALKQLLHIIGNIISIGVKLFSGLSSGGAGLFNTLDNLTTKLKNFLGTAAAQKTLHQLGVLLADISRVVSDVLIKALNELLPTLNSALPPFEQLVNQIGPLLIDILNIVGPLLQKLAKFWADNAAVINPLLIMLAAGILAFRGLSLGIKTVNNTVKGFKDGIDLLKGVGTTIGQVGMFFGRMGTAIGQAIAQGMLAFGRFMVAATQMVISVATSIAQMTVQFVQGMITMGAAIGTWIAEQAVALAGNAVRWATSIAQFAVVVARYVAGWALMAATAVADAAVIAAAWIVANPWILVIAAIALVVAYIVTHWTQIKNFMAGIWNAITSAVRSAWHGITSFISTAASDIVNSVKSKIGQMVDVGRALITGLWNGAVSIWNNFVNWVKNAASSVAGFFENILGISSPSKVMMEIGHHVTEGLTIGIQNGAKQDVPRAVNTMAAAVTRPMATAPVQTATAAGNALAGNIGGPSSGLIIQELHLHVAGNLDPTNPVQWRKTMQSIQSGIRDVERSYS